MHPLDVSKDIYIGYLPLAHVLELVTELITLNGGIAIGYSSPLTITDASTAIKSGDKGDLRVLNPTFMHSVPAVLERLSKAVSSKIKSKHWMFQLFFESNFQLKLALLKMHYRTVLLDFILFKRISKMVIGENLRFIMCAGNYLDIFFKFN
jgi:long-chain acyl-CoA synthetase